MTELLPGVETPSDAELISRVRGGDVAAYGELFSRHVEAARRLARQLVRGPDVDDLVSDAFAKTLSVLQAGGGPDVAFRAYVLTSVRRLHVDRIRASKKVQPADDMTVYDDGLPFQDTAVASFENGAAARAFSSLPERWQLVLWHLEVEGQKPAEIAPLLGMSANSVSALAYRAREGLRQAFLTMHLADCTTERCQWVNEHLGAYVRKGLSRRDTAKVEQHLDECRRCTAMYLELSEVNSDLAAIIAPLLLGAAAAGYLGSAGGVGATGASALLGRVRDAFGSHGSEGSSGASSSATGGTAAAGGASAGGAVTAGTLTAGGLVAAGVVAVTTAALLFGGGAGRPVTDADRPPGTVQTRPGSQAQGNPADARRDPGEKGGSARHTESVVVVAAGTSGDAPADASGNGSTSPTTAGGGAPAATDPGSRDPGSGDDATATPEPGGRAPGQETDGQDPAPVGDPILDIPPLIPGGGTSGDGSPGSDGTSGDGTSGDGSPSGDGVSPQGTLTVADPRIEGGVLLFEVSADGELPQSVTVSLTDAPVDVGFAPEGARSTISGPGEGGATVIHVAIRLVGLENLPPGTTLEFTVDADGYTAPTTPIEVVYSPPQDESDPGSGQSGGDGGPSPATGQVTGISLSGPPARQGSNPTLWDVVLAVQGLPAGAGLVASDLELLSVADPSSPADAAPVVSGSVRIEGATSDGAGRYVVTLHVPASQDDTWFVLRVVGRADLTTEPFQVGGTEHGNSGRGTGQGGAPDQSAADRTPGGRASGSVSGTTRMLSRPKARAKAAAEHHTPAPKTTPARHASKPGRQPTDRKAKAHGKTATRSVPGHRPASRPEGHHAPEADARGRAHLPSF